MKAKINTFKVVKEDNEEERDEEVCYSGILQILKYSFKIERKIKTFSDT